jgi:hypothetical protein
MRLLFLLIYGFVIPLVAATALTFRRAIRALFANSWPTTEAVIQYVSTNDPERGICAVRVEYEYQVDDVFYYGQISYECLLPVFAERFASHFTPRATYLVHYKPDDPSTSFMPSNPLLVRFPSAAAAVNGATQ